MSTVTQLGPRVIHRTIREYLVAEHLATLPVNEAAERLEPHLWFDADWEEVVCAASALHPHRDDLLERVVSATGRTRRDALVTRSGLLEPHLHLARVARETQEDDWRPASAALIHEARSSLAPLVRCTAEAGDVVERGRD